MKPISLPKDTLVSVKELYKSISTAKRDRLISLNNHFKLQRITSHENHSPRTPMNLSNVSANARFSKDLYYLIDTPKPKCLTPNQNRIPSIKRRIIKANIDALPNSISLFSQSKSSSYTSNFKQTKILCVKLPEVHPIRHAKKNIGTAVDMYFDENN